MYDEFYDLLNDEENMDLLDVIIDWIDSGVEDDLEIEALNRKIDELEEYGEDVLVEKLREEMNKL